MQNKQLQMLISKIEDEKLRARQDCEKTGNNHYAVKFKHGRITALNFCIRQLTEILNEGSVAASAETHPSDCLCQICIS